MGKDENMGAQKKKFISFETNKEINSMVASLKKRGISKSEAIRAAIRRAYAERSRITEEPLDAVDTRRLLTSVDIILPKMEIRANVAEGDLRDVRMRLLRIERQLDIKENGDEEDKG